jgi:hypothetical protein
LTPSTGYITEWVLFQAVLQRIVAWQSSVMPQYQWLWDTACPLSGA